MPLHNQQLSFGRRNATALNNVSGTARPRIMTVTTRLHFEGNWRSCSGRPHRMFFPRYSPHIWRVDVFRWQTFCGKPSCLFLSLSPPPGRFATLLLSVFPIISSLRLQDLGKSSNDLLGKDYYFHGASLEVKTNTPSGVSFKTSGTRDAKTQAINGEIEAKWSDRKHGLTVTEAWTTSNILRTQVELENQIAKGLKLDLTTSLLPDKGAKSAVLNAIYKQSGVHTRGALDLFKVRKICATLFFSP